MALDQYSDGPLICDQTLLANCRNRTTKRTSNGRELERVGVEVARADRCRYQKDLRVEADRMTTSWNACKNRLGFVGLGFKVVD
ncbi:hypothetical protein DY000_02058540 [Brassica cretica]|uniref:Uncharacterized protein n=1 Tax=Brassica cretica TaxID=69181 RepID=A0ABQ7AWX6_BRACR|nr:hypothetical protein DY000_02058540 [Brassica cretica]